MNRAISAAGVDRPRRRHVAKSPCSMLLPPRQVGLGLLLTFLGVMCGGSYANDLPPLTLAQLRSDCRLTPDRFIRYFADFRFKLSERRQAPEEFLASRSGDCDDFACLAAEILREKKYTTRLIAVFMSQQTHVVCYVDEIHGYLDFNRRGERCPVQAAGAKLEEVAEKVAAYFRTNWLYASEFTCQTNSPRFGRIVFR